MNIKDRIRTAREGAGLSQSGLAKKLGVTPQAVQSWEDPEGATPRISKIKAIAEATGVNESWLLVGDLFPENIKMLDREKRLLDMYRHLNDDQQLKVLQAVEETKLGNDKIAEHYRKIGRS